MAVKKTLEQRISNVQNGIGKLSKDKENPFFKSKYLDINQLIEQLLPLLEKEGLTVTQPLSNIEGRTALVTRVTDGEDTDDYIVPLPENSDPQKMGSAITYFRRYALQSFFLLQTEDDDGNKASAKQPDSVSKRDCAACHNEFDQAQGEPIWKDRCPDCFKNNKPKTPVPTKEVEIDDKTGEPVKAPFSYD